MAKKKDVNYISAKEARAISSRNRKITGQIEKKRNRKHIPESEYVTKMRDENNIVEFDDVHTYFFSGVCCPTTTAGEISSSVDKADSW